MTISWRFSQVIGIHKSINLYANRSPDSIEDVAGSFGANRVPEILRSVEILGIIQARSWNLASLNEFREFFGLTRHKTFEDINPDPVVAQKLKNLYDAPDCVELYPGLVAEKAKPPRAPGSGLCVNYTTSRAILSSDEYPASRCGGRNKRWTSYICKTCDILDAVSNRTVDAV